MSVWSPELVAKLKKLWPVSSSEELVSAFYEAGLTYNALRKKAKRLGLEKKSSGLPSVKEMIKALNSEGYEIVKNQKISDHVFNLTTKGRYNGELIKIGILSDTHLCSRHQQLTHLKTLYKRFKDEGISIVLHAGDVVEGFGVYRGQEHEVLHPGADKQAEYVIKNYPQEEGMHTYMISGNHDGSFAIRSGVNIVKRICDSRSDLTYLGSYGAYLDLPGGLRAYLHHGAGGVAYARSYKLQKAVDNFAPEAKPHLYISGHYHVCVTLPDYRNVFAMHPGCFQSQTEFLRRLGVSPDVGGWILEYRVNPDSKVFDLAEITPRWIPFREVIADDY